MGVPSFYRWLVNKYPKIVTDVREKASADMEFDNLYLDMNGIIHPCFHPDSDNIVPPTTIEEVFLNIYEYIDKLFDIVKPGKLVFMAIDGVAPRAKMNQQRARRFKTAKDNENAEKIEEMLRRQFAVEGKKVLPKEQSELSDSNIITPGTQFMCILSEKLQGYIKLRMTTDSRWKTIKVILSDANVPGEGEHKIMSFIHAQRCCKDYDPNTRHCLYGLDADLIMLALATHEVHFSILREEVLVPEERVNPVSELQRTAQQTETHLQKSRGWFKQQPVSAFTPESCHPEAASISPKQKMSGREALKKIPFQLLNVWILREYLQIDLSIADLPENSKFELDLERLIDDFVFMCFFAGNDFLPHMPTLAIHECAIDLLIHVYKNEFKNLGGYLIDAQRIEDKKAGYIKLKRVEKFILAVGQYEDKIFRKRSEMRDRLIRRIIDAEKAENQEIDAKFERDAWNVDSTFSSGKAASGTLDGNQTLLCGVVQVTADDSEVLKNTRELRQKLKEQIRLKSDTFRNGDLGTDKIKLGTPGYKERYYDEKFSTNNHDERERKRKEVVQKYTEGLCWVLKYYYAGVPSWSWYYPFHYGPFASDFKGLSQVKIMFQKGLPFKPFDQLMAVLPPKSAKALPGVYRRLMLDENSNIIDFYPTDFKVDVDGKRYLWQAVCKLPFIQEERLLTEMKIVEKELKDYEKQRNANTADRLFVSSLSSLVEQISSIQKSSLSSTESSVFHINTMMSNGISGFMRLEFNGLTATDFNGKSKDPDVLCVFYELPRDCLHKPHLLGGVNVPEKTISEEDIVESVLWHDSSGNTSNRRPLNQIQKVKFSSKNEVHGVVHKDAGIGWVKVCSSSAGWGGGRGKVCSSSAGQISIGHRQVSELSQDFKSIPFSANQNFRQSSSTRSHRDWRLDQQYHPTPSERGWKNGNRNHPSQTSSQSFSPLSAQQESYGRGIYITKAHPTPSERGWKNGNPNHPSQTSSHSFSPLSAQQQSYGRGIYRTEAHPTPSERGWKNGNPNHPSQQQSYGRGIYIAEAHPTPAERGWKNGNPNHPSQQQSYGRGIYITEAHPTPSERGWKNVNPNHPSQTSTQSFSPSFAQQQSYGRGIYITKAAKAKDTNGGSF